MESIDAFVFCLSVVALLDVSTLRLSGEMDRLEVGLSLNDSARLVIASEVA